MISCTDVCFSYDGHTRSLDGVSLDIADGEFLCILGGNGSGKSTLAKHLNALLTPDSGRVTVDGLDTADAELVYDIRSRVGMVFQNPDDQLVATLVENDVAFGPENLGVACEELSPRVEAALADVGLMGFEHHETHALSGGQKQRVAIAGVLAMHPKVLILDEASSMLDPRGRHGLLKVCRELNRAGMTIVMITHFMEEAAQADRVVVLNHGHIALQGTPEDVLTQAEVLEGLNLEVPYSCQLGYALARRGVNVAPHVDEAAMLEEIERKLASGSTAGEGTKTEANPDSRTKASTTSEPCAEASLRVPGDLSAPSSTSAASGQSSTPTADTSAAQDSCAPTATPASAGSAPTAAPLLEFQHVFFSYEKTTRERARRRKKARANGTPARWGNDPHAEWALADVSFTVQKGELLGIAGHTGSGKSTLIQHMNGLAHPTEGRVLIDGRDLADKHVADAVKTKVGVVFQYPEHQLFANSVYEDVAFGPRNLGCNADEVDARVREALAQVSLPFDEVAQKSPFELSGGQQRRCAFAGVLAMQPEVLVLDEPVAGLDPAARREFLDLVNELHAQGLTVVMVSHSMEDLAERCDRVLIVNRGAIAACGTPREVFSDEASLKAIGLGLPAAQRMAYRLADAGAPLSTNTLYGIESLAESLAPLMAGGER